MLQLSEGASTTAKCLLQQSQSVSKQGQAAAAAAPLEDAFVQDSDSDYEKLSTSEPTEPPKVSHLFKFIGDGLCQWNGFKRPMRPVDGIVTRDECKYKCAEDPECIAVSYLSYTQLPEKGFS